MEDEKYFILSCNFILVTHLGGRVFGEADVVLASFTCVAGLPVIQLRGGLYGLHHPGLSLTLCVQVLWVVCPLQRRFGIAAQIS